MRHFGHLIATPSDAFASRRQFLRRTGAGAGMLALASILGEQGLLAAPPDPKAVALNPLAPRKAQLPAKARSVIWLFMNGGQSQVDTWDYKPALDKADGQKLEGFDNKTGFFVDQV